MRTVVWPGFSGPCQEGMKPILAEEAKKRLIIAEKPSVAADIVRALPEKFKKEDTYYEGPSTLVSFAVGHLVTLATPKEMDEKHKSWSLQHLPILPEKFMIKALPRTKGQLNTLAKLIKRKDVEEIINACDAGREGELIFRYILQFVSETKPVKKTIRRLWLQSMTQDALRQGFEKLRSDEEMAHLADAALCRSEADWLVGINGSRGLTGWHSQHGGFFLTPCGRVQTPTLSMLVRREGERDAFVPKDYWELKGDFSIAGGGVYEGKWFDPVFKKGEDETAKADRIFDKAKADAIIAKCEGKTAQVTETQKPSSQSCPPLYDLTSLQREANQRFGFSAKATLGLAQALYERHKAVTYPRTDSRHLPDDYLPVCQDLMKRLQKGDLGAHAKVAADKGYVKPDKRIFDGAKVSDHFAIIPTQEIPSGLTEPEQKVYRMIVQRFIGVFYPAARFLNTSRISVVEGESFKTEGKVLEEPGWKAVYGVDADEEAILTALPDKAKVALSAIELRSETTKPPPRLNESTLLSFMESAGKYVEDEDLAAALKERGLGTPATRAAIIEGLIDDKYVVREGKELVPTAKGIELLRLLSAMEIEELVSPELTGEWESKLNRIEKGQITRDAFMDEIRALTRTLVERIKSFDEEAGKGPAGFVDPRDGKPMIETFSRWETEDGSTRIRKVLGGRHMAPEEVQTLLRDGRLGPLTGFRSKAGKSFSAMLRMTGEGKVEFVFEEAGGEGGGPEIVNEEPLGVSPIDGSPVLETLTTFQSQSSIDGDQEKGLRIGKVILGKTLGREDIRRLLAGEKTELLQGFQSARTRRFFDAYLKLSAKGKLEFEFPPRVFKGRKGKSKTPAASEPEG